jgi:hypothetical protein
MHGVNWLTRRLTGPLLFRNAAWASRIPIFTSPPNPNYNKIHILTSEESTELVPNRHLQTFNDKKQASSTQTVGSGNEQKEISDSYYNENSWKKIKDISSNTSVTFSKGIQKRKNFEGIASEVLQKAYKFSRKQKDEEALSLSLEDIDSKDYIVELVKCKIRAAEWANERGNAATTVFMLEQTLKVA